SDAELMLGSETSLVGVQQHFCEWPENSGELLKDWSQPKRLAVDRRSDVGDDVSSELDALRLPLHAFEIETLRKLGIRVARAIEKGAREVCRGDTEAQIAGDIASRLVRHDVTPERIQVWGDGRGQACPNWTFRRAAVEHFFTISVIARRQGLHVAVSRTVSFGTPPKELRWTHSDMLLAHATAIHALRDQVQVSTVVSRVREASEKLGFVPDWSATLPGCVTGYAPCEAPLSMQSSFHLRSGMPLIWQSSLGPARAVDTLLVRKADGKVITQTGEWPQVSLSIDGVRLFGQAVLQRSL
ncbi:MAG: Xaa-Pro aminopeptidase, partial [Planctomycetota bacterium]